MLTELFKCVPRRLFKHFLVEVDLVLRKESFKLLVDVLEGAGLKLSNFVRPSVLDVLVASDQALLK
jgi:hypothetical protein